MKPAKWLLDAITVTRPPVAGGDQYSDFDPTKPNPAVNNYPGALVFAGDGTGREGKRSLVPGYYGAWAPRLSGACYNTVAPGYAFSLSGVYQPKDGQFGEVEGATSPVNAPREVRQREAEAAENWFTTITVETFG